MDRLYLVALILLLASETFAQEWKKELAVIPAPFSTKPEPAVSAYEALVPFKGGWIVLGQPGDPDKQVVWETLKWGDEPTNAVTRFDPSGRAVYMVRASKTNGQPYELTALSVQPNGSAWIGGFVKRNSVTIGSANTRFSSPTRSLFLLHVDSTGRSLKAMQADTMAGYSTLRASRILANGNLLLFGECGAALTIAGHTLTGGGRQNLFMLEMKTDGSVVRSLLLASSDSCSIGKIVQGTGDRWYAVISYRTRMVISGDTLTSPSVSSVIMKFTTSGEILGYRHAGAGLYAKDLALSEDRLTVLLARNDNTPTLLTLDRDTIGLSPKRVADVVLRLDTSLSLRSFSKTYVETTNEIAPPLTRIIEATRVSNAFAVSTVDSRSQLRYGNASIYLEYDVYTLVSFDLVATPMDTSVLPGAVVNAWKRAGENVILASTGIYSRPAHSLITFNVRPPAEKICVYSSTPWYLGPTGASFHDTNRFFIYGRPQHSDWWQLLAQTEKGSDTAQLYVYTAGAYEVLVKSTAPEGLWASSARLDVALPPKFIAPNSINAYCSDTAVMVRPVFSGLIPPVRYRWSTGDTTEFISVEESGDYRVTVHSGACHITATINVYYSRDPDTPVIEFRNDTLFAITSDPPAQYRWLRDMQFVRETFDPFIIPNASGHWTVQAKELLNCFSPPSTGIDVEVGTGSVGDDRSAVHLYPNPFNDCFELANVPGSAYSIVDVLGVTRATGMIDPARLVICPEIEAGTYRLVLDTGESWKIVKH